jgi:hypothetical protein
MLKRQEDSGFDDREAIQADLDRALTTAFCRVLDMSHETPMAVLTVMAGAIGSIYRQVADTHQGQQCPCGWQPALPSDIESLQSALKAAATQPIDKLLTMQPLGRA